MVSLQYDVFRGSKDGDIHKTTTKRGPLERDEVLVKITHSGLCYTDVHFRPSGCAPGHEGVGVVDQLGPNVRSLQAGERIGWGYQRDTCGHCEECLLGDDMYCPDVVLYGLKDLDQGSFATHIVIREPFLIKIPDAISLELAGPLMCGGITVFEPMFRYGVKSTDRVGVIGLGGLGHLAVQFLSKMGCQVIVFSSTDSKRDEAFQLGATEFYITKGQKAGELQVEKLNKLFVTTSSPPEWDLYLPILAPHAVVFPIVLNFGNFSIPNMILNLRPLTIQVQHNIKPMIEKFEMSQEGITKAYERITEGSLRYRAVLEWK